MGQLGMHIVLQVPGDGIGEILRRGCKWHTAEKQGKADDSDDSVSAGEDMMLARRFENVGAFSISA
jgi:hypothetical protein